MAFVCIQLDEPQDGMQTRFDYTVLLLVLDSGGLSRLRCFYRGCDCDRRSENKVLIRYLSVWVGQP